MNLMDDKLKFLHLTYHGLWVHHLKLEEATHNVLLWARILDFNFWSNESQTSLEEGLGI